MLKERKNDQIREKISKQRNKQRNNKERKINMKTSFHNGSKPLSEIIFVRCEAVGEPFWGP